MRWLMIVMFVSMGALLFAAAGLARHIWLQHKEIREKTPAVKNRADESEVELEP